MRIDTQVYEKETSTLPEDMRVLNTLADVRVVQNTLILCDEKSDEEKQGEANPGSGEGNPEPKDQVELVDDSENIRTVIVNTEVDVTDFQRY